MYKVLAFAGSLRKDSINKKLLNALKANAPENLEIEIFDIANIPLYNSDTEAENFPEVVKQLKEKITAADGVLIVTPEYNWSVPGVVKNVIDWASRPYGQSVWGKKCLAITGATSGWQGTVRSQTMLKSILQMMGAYVMPEPELLVSHFDDNFDREGNPNQETAQKLTEFMAGISDWISHFKR